MQQTSLTINNNKRRHDSEPLNNEKRKNLKNNYFNENKRLKEELTFSSSSLIQQRQLNLSNPFGMSNNNCFISTPTFIQQSSNSGI